MNQEQDFCGKRILFIGPKFFGYEQEIAQRLRERGAVVDFYDDRPSENAIAKIVIRILPKLISKQIRNYFEDIISRLNDCYDYVLIIKLECMPVDIVKVLRKKLSGSRFIFYSWDSIRNNPNFENAAEFFDDLYTFDTEDAARDRRLQLRPLFYVNEYSDIDDHDLEFDLLFVGTIHSDRFSLIRKVRSLMDKSGSRVYFYMFVPHPLVYWFRRFLSPDFWAAKRSDFEFVPMKKHELIIAIGKSKAVLDIQHPNQTGLTMRTIEVLGARKKLITTNVHVREYDFYRPENILVIDRNAPVIDPEFLSKPNIELAANLYRRYSLDGWIDEIFAMVPRG